MSELYRRGGNGDMWFWCPGCDDLHRIRVEGPGAWSWDAAALTATPSILVRGGSKGIVCHSYLRGGRWEFLSDSTHELAGKTVDMVPLPEWSQRNFADLINSDVSMLKLKNEYEVNLDDIQKAVEEHRLTLEQGLDAAHALGKTGLPEEYFEALGVKRKELW